MTLRYLCVLLLIYAPLSNCDQIPRTILPIKYDITVTPYFETETDSYFNGYLVFTFKPLKHNQVRRLAIHADGLDIHSFVLLENNRNATVRQDVTSDSENQLLYFDYGHLLAVDKTYELRINYSGRISDDGWGLYKGFYEHDGKKRFYAATQLRPIFARRLFPCLDEPVYKARFTLRVWRLPQYTARANMPLVDTSPISLTSGRVLDTFSETPDMSPFLLALVVFDFSSLTSQDGTFTTWTIPTSISLAEHGHRRVPDLVRTMEAIAGCAFPLPKMDQIALPQLNPVAMENWGMNTYREVNMLYKEGAFAPIVRQNVPRFTSHEVTHHWLGNLVTLEWWSWLWVSEMYAMYYEYYLPSQVEPSWKMADQMVVSLVLPGLLEDSFNNSRPLTTNVSTNEEILAKFSGLTYTKGPSLVRMIDGFLSHYKAEEAIKTLIREKKYGNVNPSELWKIYDWHAEGLPADMQTIMGSWTDQPGYPLVTVTVNQSEGSVILHQERFLVDGSSSDSSLWWIPITFTSGNRPNFTNTHTRLWLSPDTPVSTVRLSRHIHTWMLFNIQHIGFYRVNYDLPNWEKLIDLLLEQPSTIHELNRAQLLDDSLALARAGKLPYDVAFKLATYLRQERCFSPWASFIQAADFLLKTFNGHPVQESLREFMKHLVAPVYSHLGFSLGPTDPHLRQMNRVQVVTFACSIGLPACISDAKQHEDLISRGQLAKIPPGLEFTQLCTILESGSASTNWTHKLSLWSAEDQIKAIPCVADKAFLTRYLTKSVQEDAETVWRAKLTASVSRPASVSHVFSLLVDQYEVILTKFGSKNLTDYFNLVGSLLSTTSQLDELSGLSRRINDTEIEDGLTAVSIGLRGRLKWIEDRSLSLQSWANDLYRMETIDTVLSPVDCS